MAKVRFFWIFHNLVFLLGGFFVMGSLCLLVYLSAPRKIKSNNKIIESEYVNFVLDEDINIETNLYTINELKYPNLGLTTESNKLKHIVERAYRANEDTIKGYISKTYNAPVNYVFCFIAHNDPNNVFVYSPECKYSIRCNIGDVSCDVFHNFEGNILFPNGTIKKIFYPVASRELSETMKYNGFINNFSVFLIGEGGANLSLFGWAIVGSCLAYILLLIAEWIAFGKVAFGIFRREKFKLFV